MTAIIGINIGNRIEEAVKFQQIITEFGCDIRTRIGLHNTDENECINNGIILLEVVNNTCQICDTLSKYWQIQTMKF